MDILEYEAHHLRASISKKIIRFLEQIKGFASDDEGCRMDTKEFKELVDNFIRREDDRIESSTFLKAMEELERQRARKKIELTGEWKDGEIIFDEPAPVPVEHNTIFIGETQVILKIRYPSASTT